MSNVFEVPAEIREDNGKGASRRLRLTGMVPGIVYGAGRPSRSVQIEHRFLNRALEEESFYSSILELTIGDGRTQKVVLRDLQRHPWKAQVMHIDFQRISEDQELRISVPLHFVNEEKSEAEKTAGVVISHQMNEVEISCLPKHLPEYLEVDLQQLEVGDLVHLSDIKLPEGVEIIALSHDEDSIIVSAQHVTIQVEEPTEEEEPTTEVIGEKSDEDEEAADSEGDDEGDDKD